MSDLISRQAAQERQRVTQKRRYTFGNDEVSLEAAYHDCKLVFDGITDDDSFQEADTGLVLYYANEIIYALHKALQGKDTNVLSNDCISRQAAIEALFDWEMTYDWDDHCREEHPKPGYIVSPSDVIEKLPSAQPEIVRCKDCKHRYTDECPMRYIEWVERDEYGEYELRDIVHDYTEDEKFCSEGERR